MRWRDLLLSNAHRRQHAQERAQIQLNGRIPLEQVQDGNSLSRYLCSKGIILRQALERDRVLADTRQCGKLQNALLGNGLAQLNKVTENGPGIHGHIGRQRDARTFQCDDIIPL